MNWLRNGLIGAILLTVFLLFIRWNEFQEAQVAARAPSQETTLSSSAPELPSTSPVISSDGVSDDDIPSAPGDESASVTPVVVDAPTTELIEVKTDTLHVLIDPRGGDIVKVSLSQYRAELKDESSEFILLNRTPSHTYVAESDLVGPNGLHTRETGRPLYSVSSNRFELPSGQDTLEVDLTLTRNDVAITKRFTFTRDTYLIDVAFLIDNNSDASFKAAMYGRIKRDDWVPPTDAGFGMQPYLGAAITTPESNYKKLDFDELDDGAFKVEQDGGWVAMIQHYFVSAWIPDASLRNNFELRRSVNRQHYFLGFTSPLITVAAGAEERIAAQFYAGPKIIKNLEGIAPYLDLTIDFSWLWFIAKPLFLALDFIHDFVGNWGVAIILLTCLVKLIFLYPSALSYRSMAKMRKVMPLIKELQERYGDDRQRLGMETMKLYKKEGANPLGGCLPMLLQMPVFIALYWVLMESVELRHSPFFLWIEDLSVKDPFFILPLIFGVSMYFQQKLNPAPADPMQAKIMQMLPIFFTFLFMMFPAGLVLYWVTNNILSIAQQYLITRQIEKEGT